MWNKNSVRICSLILILTAACHAQSFTSSLSGIKAFNLGNTPQFGRANTNLGDANFGKVTGLAPGATPRQIQMALRVSF